MINKIRIFANYENLVSCAVAATVLRMRYPEAEIEYFGPNTPAPDTKLCVAPNEKDIPYAYRETKSLSRSFGSSTPIMVPGAAWAENGPAIIEALLPDARPHVRHAVFAAVEKSIFLGLDLVESGRELSALGSNSLGMQIQTVLTCRAAASSEDDFMKATVLLEEIITSRILYASRMQQCRDVVKSAYARAVDADSPHRGIVVLAEPYAYKLELARADEDRQVEFVVRRRQDLHWSVVSFKPDIEGPAAGSFPKEWEGQRGEYFTKTYGIGGVSRSSSQYDFVTCANRESAMKIAKLAMRLAKEKR